MVLFFKLFSTIKSSHCSFLRKPVVLRICFFLFLTSGLAARSHAQGTLQQSDLNQYYHSALNQFDHAQYGAALVNLNHFLDKVPAADVRRPEAMYLKSFCALNLYHQDAERQVEAFIREYPVHPRASTAYFDMGSFFYQQKNYAKAQRYFEKTDFRALSSEQATTGRFRYGYSLFAQKKLKDALVPFSAIKAQGGAYGPASSYYAGFIEYAEGDYTNALIDLKRAEENDSYKPVVPFLVASTLYRLNNSDELLAYGKSVLSRESLNNREEIALLMAEAYYRKGEYSSALEGYRAYAEGKEENADKGVLLRAGHSAYQLKNNTDAIRYLRLAATSPDSTGYYASYYLGAAYLLQQQKPLAFTAFENARRYVKDRRMAEESSFQYAKIAYDLGKPDLSITEFEKFLKAYPASPYVNEVKELLSQAYINANNVNKAIEYIEALPKRSPAVDRAYQKATYLKGTEYFNKDDYANALTFFTKSLQYPIDPVYTAEANFWSGEVHALNRNWSEAAKAYQEVLTVGEAVPLELQMRNRYGLGYAFFNQRVYDRALFNFKEFVNKSGAANPNYADGVLRLADCHYVTKAYTEAIPVYRRVIQLKSPDSDYGYLQLGVILGIERRYAEATQELDQVLKLFPKSPYAEEALFQRGQLDFEQGKYGVAAAEYGRIIANGQPSRFTPYAYKRRADSYYNLKDYNQTANDYIALIDKFPTHPVTHEVLVPLQEALALAGRSGEFDPYLQKYKQANPGAKGVESVEFEAAKNQYFNQDYQKAINSLGTYLINYPESPRVSEARYYQAESYYRLKDFSKALEIFNSIAGDNSFSLASRVTARQAELEYRAGRYEQAISYFRRMYRLAVNKKDIYNASNGLMESFFFTGQYDSSAFYAQKILEKGNVNAGAENKASLWLGKIAMARGDFDSAKDEFVNTVNGARDEYGAEAKYLLGELFFATKDYKQCYETLVSLNKDFADYPQWVGKSFLLLADNFQATGEVFQARGTLQSLIDNFPLPEIKEAARKKLDALQKAEAQKQVTPADSVDNQNRR